MLLLTVFFAVMSFVVSKTQAAGTYYYLAPWEWVTEGGISFWRAPSADKLTGAVDLRSVPAQSKAEVAEGYGFFSYSEPVVIPGSIDLGDSLDAALFAATRAQIRVALGIRGSLRSSTPRDILWEILTDHADPTGETGPKPLRGKLGREVTLALGGQVVKSEPFNESHRQRTIAVFQADYERNRQAVINGQLPMETVQKWVGRTMKDLYGEMSDERAKEIVPEAYKNESQLWRIPETTIADNFTRADNAALGSSSEGWSWLEGFDIWSISGNTVAHGDSGIWDFAKANTNLSTDDQYAQANVTGPTTNTSAFEGVALRLGDYAWAGSLAASSYDAYYGTIQGWTDRSYEIGKWVNGTQTQLANSSAPSPGLSSGLVKLTVNGSNLELFVDSVSKLTASDSDLTGTLTTGMVARGVGGQTFDNFQAADLNAAPTAPSSLGGSSLVDGSFGGDNTPSPSFILSDPDASDTVKYQIQIDDSSDFSSAVVDYTSALAAQTVEATSFTVGQAAGSGTYTTGSEGQTLSDGSYYWRVKAIDNSAEASSYSTANSGSIAFKVDATAPSIPGTPSTTTPTTDTTPAWSWTASTDSGSGLATNTYSVQWCGNSGYTGCDSNTSTSTTNSFAHSTALADGTWYFKAKAADAVGNNSSYSSNGSVAVDTTAPTVSVTALSTDPTADTTPTFSGTATDATTALTAIQFQVDSTSGSWTACTADDGTIDETSETFTCTSAALSDGAHTIYIRATDSASNTTALSDYATDGFTVDATTPTISLTAISPDPTSDSTPTISGTAQDSAGTISNVQFQVDSTSGTWSSCTADDGSFNEADETFSCTTSALSDGAHTIHVRATDNSSNTLDSSQDSFTVDTTAPAAFDLKSPGNNSYINVQRPTFKWEATTDATAGLSKYTLEIDNPEVTGLPSGDFTIDGIPTSRTTDYETSKYLAHYENFDDSDSTNNYISIYTKSSSDWGAAENDGKLRSGTVKWRVKATDSAGNSTTGSSLVYVDFNNPSLSKVSLLISQIVGAKDGYSVITTTKPSITGTITDDILPNKISIYFYKQNFFLGVETSQSLELESTHTLTNTNNSTSLDFNLTIPQDIAHGKYSVLVIGVDKAGNKSDPKTLSLQIMTLLQARTLLKQTDKEKEAQKETSIISLPQLEKKALLRREKEASEFHALLATFNSVFSSIGINISSLAENSARSLQKGGSFLASVFDEQSKNVLSFLYHTQAAITNTAKNTAKNINVLASNIQSSIDKNINNVIISNGKLIGIAINSAFYKFVDQSSKQASSILNNSQRNVEKQIADTQSQTSASIKGTVQFITTVSLTMRDYTTSSWSSISKNIAAVFNKTENALNKSQLVSKQQIKNTYKDSSSELSRVGDGMKIAFRSLREPVDNSMAFLDKVRVGALTFQSIVFDSNPTRISDVAIEDIGSDFAIVSWKTNHYAWGKVNYGTDLTYGKEVLLTKREKTHTAKLTGLKPGERYFFEVMSQNKNYAYDAFYSFETKE